MTRARAAVVAVTLAALGVAAPPVAAGCAAVRSRGAWTLADAPSFADVDTTAGRVDADGFTHFTAFHGEQRVPLGLPSRLLVTNGVRILRTTDTGCSWRPAYAVDTADPANVVAHADPQYVVTAVGARRLPPGGKPTAGRDVVYLVLANGDTLTGIPQNLAGQPVFVARSLDGGATWRTDVLRATLPGATEPTPVLGNGPTAGTAIVAPADPRVGYLMLESRDPRSTYVSAEKIVDKSLYVTRDLGATWSYATPLDVLTQITADPVDPAVLYTAARGHVRRITVGATATTTANLFDFPVNDTVAGIDVVRPAKGPARIVVSTWFYDAKGKRLPRFHWSGDGGRTWLSPVVQMPFAGTWDSTLVGEREWLTASGDVVALVSVLGGGAYTTLVLRWDARRRAWRTPVAQVLPAKPGRTAAGMDWVGPVDSAHRWFAVGGNDVDNAHVSWSRVAGVWDSGR